MDIAALPPRERILVTAHGLFYRDGIRATGIDRIIAESGVAKLTFYRHFPGKDDLIRTFLAYRHERWMAWFVDSLGRHGARPGGGLKPLIEAMAEWFEDPLFRGCAFINAVAEIAGSLPDVVSIARAHKLEMQQVIGDLLPAGPGQDKVAEAVALAVDGAIVRAQTEDAASALAGLKTFFEVLAPGSGR